MSNYPRHKITRNLPLSFFPGAASLAPLPMRGADVRVTPLVQTSDAARSEAIAPGGKPDVGVQTIAVLATRKLAGATGQNDARAELFLVGDGDFASNSFFHILGNGVLFLNAVSYLAEQEQLIDITPRNYELPRVQLTNRQMRTTFVVSTLLLPAAALALSLFAWWRRRR